MRVVAENVVTRIIIIGQRVVSLAEIYNRTAHGAWSPLVTLHDVALTVHFERKGFDWALSDSSV